MISIENHVKRLISEKNLVLISKNSLISKENSKISLFNAGRQILYFCIAERGGLKPEETALIADKHRFQDYIKKQFQELLPNKEILQIECFSQDKEFLVDNKVLPVVDKSNAKICFISMESQKLVPFCEKRYRKLLKFEKGCLKKYITPVTIKFDKNISEGIHENFINSHSIGYFVFDQFLE